MQWNSNNPHYLTLNEVHKLFIDYFLHLSVKFDKKEDGFDFGDPSSSVSGGSSSDTGEISFKSSVNDKAGILWICNQSQSFQIKNYIKKEVKLLPLLDLI